jgi:hypothetical protein
VDLEITADPRDKGFIQRTQAMADESWEEKRKDTEDFLNMPRGDGRYMASYHDGAWRVTLVP